MIQDALRGHSVSSCYKSVKPDTPDFDAPRDISKNLLDKVGPFESVQLNEEGVEEELNEDISEEHKAMV